MEWYENHCPILTDNDNDEDLWRFQNSQKFYRYGDKDYQTYYIINKKLWITRLSFFIVDGRRGYLETHTGVGSPIDVFGEIGTASSLKSFTEVTK